MTAPLATDFVVKPLAPATLADFARLVEKHNGFTRVRPLGEHHWLVTATV
jgi:hypothetical protein